LVFVVGTGGGEFSGLVERCSPGDSFAPGDACSRSLLGRGAARTSLALGRARERSLGDESDDARVRTLRETVQRGSGCFRRASVGGGGLFRKSLAPAIWMAVIGSSDHAATGLLQFLSFARASPGDAAGGPTPH